MKILDATSWLDKNKERYTNGSLTSDIMEGYAKYYHQFKTTNSPTTKDYDHVNLILINADKYGLKEEVEMSAQHYLNEEPGMDMIKAYTSAYNDWVK